MWKNKKKKGKLNKEIKQSLRQAGDLSEQIKELERQIAVSEREYEAVTSYLTDMQKIERLSPAVRQTVNDAARGIINLNRERQKYQNSNTRLAGNRYRVMERYEREIPNELRNLHEQEQRLDMINADMRQLEGERAVIQFEREEAANKKVFLRNLAIGGGILLVILFGGLLGIGMAYEITMTLPLLMTAVMAAAIIAYIATTMIKCDEIERTCVSKMNRLIQITNKVKIKLVNCTNTLEYCYDKYEVGSYRELADVWEKYVMTKDDERKYRNSTEFLEQYSRQLVLTLSQEGIADPQIWVYQTEALLESKEMVEVRHHLNTRRQKVRERLEFENQQLAFCKAELAKEGSL